MIVGGVTSIEEVLMMSVQLSSDHSNHLPTPQTKASWHNYMLGRTESGLMQAGIGWVALTPLGWRWLLAISSVPLLILALLYPVVPESPLWLSAAGRTEDAEKVLRKVAAINKKDLPPGHLRHVVSASQII